METQDSATTGRLAHPLPTRPETPTNSGFGMRQHPVTGTRQMHYGIDVAVDGGTRIGALDAGEVVFVGAQRDRHQRLTGAGNYVIVRHGTEATGYSYSAAFHVQTGSTRVHVGERVGQGQTLALVGTTGSSTGNHLHLEYFEGGNEALIRQGSIGGSGARRLNPADYVGRDYLDRITIQQGDRNAAVRALQQALVARGYDLRTPGRPGDGVDGAFGPRTQAAVTAFQRDREMPEAQRTGIYGPATRAEMAEAVREGWNHGMPRVGTPAPAPTAGPARTPAPQTQPPQTTPQLVTPPQTPDRGTDRGTGQTFADTPGPYAAVSTGALLDTRAGTPLGALTAAQSYALGRAIAGDGPGAAALEAVDRRLGTGSGVFVQRVLAMGQHEGGLDFGRRNPDPGRGPDDRTAGYDVGTFQVGGRNSTPATSAATFERYLTRGIQVYQALEPGAQVDRAALSVADRDILAHVGYMAARGTEAFRQPLPENEILRRMADPDVRDLARVVSNDVQGGDPDIGRAVARMTSRTDGLRVDLDAVAARGREPDALRREPSMPVFSQASATRNIERGPVFSPAVEAWQQVLQARGLNVGQGGPDGIYGPATLASTRQLQREAGLTARGIVGPQTWSRFGTTGAQTVDGRPGDGQPAPPPTPDGAAPRPDAPGQTPGRTHTEVTETLREGSRGAQVSALQQHLKVLGYPLGPSGPARDGVDGVFGPQTRRAVEALQRDNALPVTGVVDRATRAADVLHPIRIDAVPAYPAPGQPPPSGDGARSTLPVPPPADPRYTAATSAFLREADEAVSNVLDHHVADVPGALAALVRDTRGPGSGPLGATTAEDVQRSFARFTSGDATARPLSRTEAGMVAQVLDERARLVGEGAVPSRPASPAAGPPATLTPTRPAPETAPSL